MVDKNACKSFVEHQEFLGMKAQKRASERNTLPNIDWNNQDHVSSLTAHKLRFYLKQHNLQVSGGKATLVARVPWGVLPYKRLMGMCRWMGSHFHDWTIMELYF